MTKRAVNKSDIPTEVLDRIFGHCERHYRYVGWFHFLPKSRLHPLLLICKRWQNIAERRLYMCVSIGSDRAVRDKEGNRVSITGRHVCERFCDTVQNNPRIASLVRELHLSLPLELEPEDFKTRIRIVNICKNVERIHFFDILPSLVDDLKEALAKADLVSLHLTAMPDSTQERRFSPAMLLKLLPSWPRIESVSATMGDEGIGTVTYDIYPDEEDDSDFPPAVGACPSLRAISIEGDYFKPSHLRFLSDIAPNLESVEFNVQTECCNAALRESLQVWSLSLKSLSISGYLFNTPFPEDECPIIRSPLPQLRFLDMSAPLVVPSALRFLPALETLLFHGGYSHCAELARLIDNGKMQSLTKLRVGLGWSESEPPESDKEKCFEMGKELRRVCGKRNVSVQFRNRFTTSTELEGHSEEWEQSEEEATEPSDNDWKSTTRQ
ncbi:hypothetical protein SCHPADRAFT_257904 [Schizopora paradoxa]|uniref:Uncharacterized protein n=1 Tax=Schizopora paradoxa TaxID=27342 RepID=A0A0H2RUC8_9AGAM|nr:hypothetical protein SCHPADRAFT_257904 [Schizopora paradoxa]